MDVAPSAILRYSETGTLIREAASKNSSAVGPRSAVMLVFLLLVIILILFVGSVRAANILGMALTGIAVLLVIGWLVGSLIDQNEKGDFTGAITFMLLVTGGGLTFALIIFAKIKGESLRKRRLTLMTPEDRRVELERRKAEDWERRFKVGKKSGPYKK
jgi:hypothetical protein